MKKVTCKNTCCLHNIIATNGCDSTITIGENGRCENFEKGFVYYFDIVWKALTSKNFIDEVEMTPDMRIGLYYIMSVYHLGFSTQEWGNCRMYMLRDGEDGPPLRAVDIVKREMDNEKYKQLLDDFMDGILPGQNEKREQCREPGEKSDLDFGWLSPSGNFTESPFGNHEESAYEICQKNGWAEERRSWADEGKNSGLCRDFISEVKGFCLIHNPAGMGGYIVTYRKPLTKKQGEFLYEYFMDKGDRFKAEIYLKEETA